MHGIIVLDGRVENTPHYVFVVNPHGIVGFGLELHFISFGALA